MSTPNVAALYVDPLGPYPGMEGVDAWTAKRDARNYRGEWPVVAHPPCADWSRLSGMAKHVPGRRELGITAVWQVRACGGVLEHPEHSKLWKLLDLPRPNEFPDRWGGWTMQVDQVSWGHKARKRTWLYFVGINRHELEPLRGGTPTHVVSTSKREGRLTKMGALEIRKTPLAFAEWLVAAARMSQR